MKNIIIVEDECKNDRFASLEIEYLLTYFENQGFYPIHSNSGSAIDAVIEILIEGSSEPFLIYYENPLHPGVSADIKYLEKLGIEFEILLMSYTGKYNSVELEDYYKERLNKYNSIHSFDDYYSNKTIKNVKGLVNDLSKDSEPTPFRRLILETKDFR